MLAEREPLPDRSASPPVGVLPEIPQEVVFQPGDVGSARRETQ
jgi:hypothetical protein